MRHIYLFPLLFFLTLATATEIPEITIYENKTIHYGCNPDIYDIFAVGYVRIKNPTNDTIYSIDIKFNLPEEFNIYESDKEGRYLKNFSYDVVYSDRFYVREVYPNKSFQFYYTIKGSGIDKNKVEEPSYDEPIVVKYMKSRNIESAIGIGVKKVEKKVGVNYRLQSEIYNPTKNLTLVLNKVKLYRILENITKIFPNTSSVESAAYQGANLSKMEHVYTWNYTSPIKRDTFIENVTIEKAQIWNKMLFALSNDEVRVYDIESNRLVNVIPCSEHCYDFEVKSDRLLFLLKKGYEIYDMKKKERYEKKLGINLTSASFDNRYVVL